MKTTKVNLQKELEAVHDPNQVVNLTEWNIDQKYEGYIIPRTGGKMEFYKKQTREVKDGLVKTHESDDFTIQESSRCLKVTISLKKETLNFKFMMKILDKLVNTMRSMKVL